ncbi:hypothetical protein V500_04144 [Pseudogymnoascus sp. VKM F-4518 (FW-2643)]|nr:hypothetical protein V500_04144 [Pseudogymnoascus sp. VKM F-4518 (FW-2643)]
MGLRPLLMPWPPACARLLEQTRAGGEHTSLATDETRRSSLNILLSSCDYIDLLVLRSLSRSSSGGTVGDDDSLLSEGGLLEHLVDLLEGEALSLGDEEVGEGEGDAAEGALHEEYLSAEVGLSQLLADEVGGDDCDDLGEGAGRDADDADDKLCNDYAYSAKDKDAATAEALYNLEGRRGAKDVNEGSNKGDEEGVFNRAKGSEEDSSEVEDEVDTSKLLHHLEDYAKDCTADVGGALSNRAVEAVSLAAKVGGLQDDLHLVLVVSDNLSKRESLSSVFEPALYNVETGRLSNRDAVGSSVVAVLRSVDNTVGEEDTNGDAKLVARHKGTADLLRGDLRHATTNEVGDITSSNGTKEGTTGQNGEYKRLIAG